MRNWKSILIIGVLAFGLTGCTDDKEATSPLAKDSQIVEVREQWKHDLLLPTRLPTHTVSTASVVGDDKKTVSIIINVAYAPEDGANSAALEIHETLTEDTTITKLQNQSIPEIEQGLKDFKPRPPGHYYGGQINALEKVKLGEVSGYWYTTYQEVNDLKIEDQFIEFIRDGLHVTLSSSSLPKDVIAKDPEGYLTKDQLIEIAEHFKKS